MQVVQGVDDFLNVKVNVSIVVLASDGVDQLVLALPSLDQNADQSVQVRYYQGNFLPDYLCAQIFLYLC